MKKPLTGYAVAAEMLGQWDKSKVLWEKAEMHFALARAAMKLAARNEAGAQMAAEYLERAARTLREMTPNMTASDSTNKTL